MASTLPVGSMFHRVSGRFSPAQTLTTAFVDFERVELGVEYLDVYGLWPLTPRVRICLGVLVGGFLSSRNVTMILQQLHPKP